MAYIGNIPAEKYVSLTTQHFTVTATASYVLTSSVTNENGIALFINNVRQEPGGSYAYTAAGTTLTLSAATAATDTMYCVYLGKAVGTISPPDGSVNSAKIVDGSITDGDLAGSISSAKITSLDATKLTGTVNNARISLDAAEIPNLDTAKLTTGTVASARLGTGSASSTTVLYGDGTYKAEPVTDTTSIKNDISLLALQNAINGNLSAYGLKNSWIEQFENSTYIEALTNVVRDSTEYISSISEVAGTPAYATGNRKSIITPTYSGFTFAGGTWQDMLDGTATSYGSSAWPTSMTPSSGAYLRFQFTDNNTTGSTKKLITENRWYQNTTHNGAVWKWQGSNDASDWTDIGSTFTMGDGLVANTAHVNTQMSSNTTPYTYYQMFYDTGSNNSNPYWQEIEFKQADVTLTASATGSFNSTDVVPQDATNKSSVGLIILYKNNAGTNTLDTDIIAKVRANTGQAYQTLALRGIDGTTTPSGAFSDGMKIAIAPAIAVTAGQALSYEISFANQAISKEARIYGVAMTY